ncbi:MAG TPA: hypothetical protein PLG90_06285 [Ignavibacteria bacterium]|nr:hypothetical protein [Ignavibacteria bacterium]
MIKNILIIAFTFLTVNVYADSPITSTDFYKAYTDMEMVRHAKECGLIAPAEVEFLRDPLKPIDEKVAIINAFGWEVDGKDNANKFSNIAYGKPYDSLDLEYLSANDLFVLGYLKIMDNYNSINTPLYLINKAGEENPELLKSFTYNIIRSLVLGQELMNKDFCQVWKVTEKVLDDKSIIMDMKQGAKEIIIGYIKEYKSYCK